MAKKKKPVKKKPSPRRSTGAQKKKTRKKTKNTFGGNTVSLSYVSPNFIATITLDTSNSNVTWGIDDVNLYDPDGDAVGPMQQISQNNNVYKYALEVDDPMTGDWSVSADFSGTDTNEMGSTSITAPRRKHR